MSTTNGALDCMNVVELSYVDNGRSLRIELTGSVPPYETMTITLRNAYSVRLSLSPDDEYPFFVPEIHWHTVEKEKNANLLNDAKYDFFGADRKFLVVDRQLVVLQLEGTICGQVIAEAVECE